MNRLFSMIVVMCVLLPTLLVSGCSVAEGRAAHDVNETATGATDTSGAVDAGQDLRDAAELRKDLRYEEALESTERALHKDPNNVQARAMKEMMEEAIILRNTRHLYSRQRAQREQAPPGSLPSAEEEVWVIVRDRAGTKPPLDGAQGQRVVVEEAPGCGAMVTRIGGDDRNVPVPLEHTDVRGSIAGYIATVDVTQRFHNPFSEKIEAVYVFPLPENAAVNEFVMTVGTRKIRGIIRERQEAERVYQQARSQGHVASLLTQERPNIFTQKVANIEPGKRIDVTIRYFHTLAYDEGEYEWVFPMVVGPRFNPPHASDGIGAVGRGDHGASGQSTEVQYVRPGERSGHDVSLSVAIDAGVEVEKVTCGSHDVRIDRDGSRATVTLKPGDSIPNRDFVLRYRVAGDQLKAAMMTHRPPGRADGYFSLMLFPPAELSRLDRHPLEVVFVVDCSGSMEGRPIEQAKDAIDRALRKLRPEDTFQVIRFSNEASQFGDRPVIASGGNIDDARRFVRSLRADGGTMMIHGMRRALSFPHDPTRLRYVVFLTDGFIGNEAEVLTEMRRLLGESRVFSFGVGEAPNRYLMHAMAKLGRGAVTFLPLRADAGGVMDDFIERISHPALADLRIDWGGLDVEDVQPRRPADLFVGRPVIVTGRFRDRGERRPVVRVQGVAGPKEITVNLRVSLDDTDANHPALATVWARQKIAQLMDDAIVEPHGDLPGRVRQLALDHSLMSAYTAFLAVDGSDRTAGDHGVTVPVPVHVPEGVRYETTVEDDGG